MGWNTGHNSNTERILNIQEFLGLMLALVNGEGCFCIGKTETCDLWTVFFYLPSPKGW